MLFLRLVLQTLMSLAVPEWLLLRIIVCRTDGVNDPQWTVEQSITTIVEILEECDRQCAGAVYTFTGRPAAISGAKNCFRLEAMKFIMDHSFFLRVKCNRSSSHYELSRALVAITMAQYIDCDALAWRSYVGSRTWLGDLERQLKERLTAIGQLFRQHQLTSQLFEHIPH